MNSVLAGSVGGVGVYLTGHRRRSPLRHLGFVLLGVAGSLIAFPALADQNLMVADNGVVACDASARDLTRISLKDDQFAAVSKVATGVASEDFSVVNEPVRGDIYVSVPDGFSKPSLSFFGTTRKGYVYKFVCTVSGNDAKQVFIANADVERGAGGANAAEPIPASLSTNEAAVRLVKAMFEQSGPEGFEVRPITRAPVNVGSLKVQLVGEYRGPILTGKEMRIENKGAAPVTITEEMIAPTGAIAVSITQPLLQPGQATVAYTVFRTGVQK